MSADQERHFVECQLHPMPLFCAAQQEAERARFVVEKVSLIFSDNLSPVTNITPVLIYSYSPIHPPTHTHTTHITHYTHHTHTQAEQIKQAAIISSSGDSQAAQLLSNAFQDAGDGLIELRRLEAAEEIAGTLSRSRNVAYLPGGGQNLLLSIPP